MRVVWHGNYFKYIEERREDFGRKYGIGYFDIEAQELLVPVVHSAIDYKKSLRDGERIRVETRFENTPAAKIIFHYTIIRTEDGTLIATGKTDRKSTRLNS